MRFLTGLREIKQQLDGLRNQVFTELDEHRDALNADTEEIGIFSSRLDDIEQKLDAMHDKLHGLHFGGPQPYAKQEGLTLDEQRVFLTLYTEEEFAGLTHAQISDKSGLNESFVSSLLHSLTEKNIPIEELPTSNEARVRLNARFKEAQTKHNIITISEHAVSSLQTKQHITLDRFSF